jgi:hypothetical protein
VQATRPTAGGLLLSHEAHPRESFHFWIADVGSVPADALKMLRLFLGQRSGILSSVLLQQEVIDAQTEVLHRLCGAVESRSKETGAHIRRIAKNSAGWPAWTTRRRRSWRPRRPCTTSARCRYPTAS